MSAGNYPRISIVTTCFNREAYIAETIESVLSQNYPNLEYIVIDDGSTDRSWEIIQSYKGRLTHIERLEGNRTSPVHALNIGLSKITGDVMTTLTDKNILLPKSLFTIAKVFNELPQIEWVTGIGCIIDKDGCIADVIPVRKDLYETLYGVPWNIQHESTFWRRSLWDRTGAKMDEEYPWAFDSGMWRKFFLEAKLYHLNTVIGAYRKLPTAQSTAHKDVFYGYVEKARQDLRKKVPKTDIFYAELYRILRLFKPLIRNIPDTVYSKIPVINHLAHASIRFKDLNSKEHFKIYRRNPFRTIFPW